MKFLHLEIKTNQPKGRALESALVEAIRTKLLHSHQRLPSIRQLSEETGIHRNTVLKVMDELIAQGWLYSVPRRGYFVSKELPQLLQEMTEKKASHAIDLTTARSPSPLILGETKSARLDLRSGLSSLKEFPVKEFFSHTQEASRRCIAKNLDYGSMQGDPFFLRTLDEYLARARGIRGRSTIVTHGSQEGLLLLSQLFIKAGDEVAVPELTYPPAAGLFQLMGAKIIPTPLDEKGLRLSFLRQRLKRRKLKAIYLTPLHQYPTTVTMAPERRVELYRLAKKHKIPIFEDDYSHEYHYDHRPLKPLASTDASGIVFYVSSFSKILLPTLRLGFLSVPNGYRDSFLRLKRMSTGPNDFIMQDTVRRWIEVGGFERHLRRTRRKLLCIRNELDAELQKYEDNLSWEKPMGGMSFWINVGKPSKSASEQLLKRGIAVSPEYHYRLDRKDGPHIRVGFGRLNTGDIPKVAREIGRVSVRNSE